MNAATGAVHERAISRAAIPASICSRSSDDPARMSIGSFVVLVLVRRVAPARTRSGSGGAERVDQRDAGFDRPERRAIEHVNLAAAARWSARACGTSARTPRAGRTRRAAPSAFIAVGEPLRVDPRRADAARTAASCRALPRRSCLRTAPCPDRRSRVSSVGMFGDGITHGSPVVVEVHRRASSPPSRTTSRSAPMPNVLVEQPRELADRHAVAHRNRILADERLEAVHAASALRPARRRSDSGRSQTITLHAVPRARRAGSWPSCRCRCRCACRRPADR